MKIKGNRYYLIIPTDKAGTISAIYIGIIIIRTLIGCMYGHEQNHPLSELESCPVTSKI